MDLDKLLEDIKKELSIENSQVELKEDSNKIFQSPIQNNIYKNIGDFGVVNETHKDGHKGIDMGAPKGTKIYPIASGIVTKVGQDPKGGNIVVMQHKIDNSIYRSYYAHLDSITCNINDKIDLNNSIGTVGQSGNAKGRAYHLHLQVWKDGKLINPATLFDFKKYMKG